MLNFPKLEEEILDFWKQQDIFKKTLKKESPRGPFTFYEGPPTANGKPGIHHVLARAFKDLIPRFKTMQGFLVERKAGWDTHGLPVELQVEKALKISGKPEIEKYGVEEFNKQCKQSVWQYQEEWEKLTQRIGFWLDLENPYVTYHKDYIESLWYIFKKIYERGLLYQGHKVVPHCPRCGTALSSHEVAQGYKEVTEPSVYVKFKVKTGNSFVKKGDYILSWTTTPWTLPGNVALAVGEKIDYVKVYVPGEGAEASEKLSASSVKMQILSDNYYILAKSLAQQVLGDYKIVSEFKGRDLIGLEYEPLFPGAIPVETENYQNAFKVYPADFVTTSDGTGVVHTAVMYGEDDYNLGTAVSLPKHHTVDEAGKFIIDFPGLTGKFVKNKEAEETVINHLKQNGLFFSSVDYTHDYPFCWRCSTPLLYYAKNSWFIKMSALSQDLIKENQAINWIPEHIKNGRFGEWLAGVKDWAISRERYWGTPLPIWVCADCQTIKVIGSYQELAEATGLSKPTEKDFDPHKPYIDEYKLKCSCGGQMSRVKEVADCWFDSGSMPLAQFHYPFENKEKVDSHSYYPADYICEAIDQTRGWFYTLLAVGVLMAKGAPYKNVICLGHINDAQGQKMSKSKGNIVDPWEVINQWGADALRFHLYTVNQPGESKNFDIKNVAEVVKKNFLILFNVLTFYKTYATTGQLPEKSSQSKNVLDQWIIAKLNQLLVSVTENLEQYNIFSAGRSISEFINELSTWYLRRSRDRFKSDDEQDKQAAIDTLGFVLLTVAKVMAPFTPFVAEELYQQLGGQKESVHLEDWPASSTKFDEKILSNMEIVRKIVELALAKRDEAGIKVRQILAELKVKGAKLTDEFSDLIKDEVNIKEVVYKKGESVLVELDTTLTDELKAEGLFRELVRTVNQLRKEAGLTINDKVEIYYQSQSAMVNKVINLFKNELLKNTLSKSVLEGGLDNSLISKEVEINGEKVTISLK
ncbi:MAG: isoleucine--tRNA ligase [Candidatus Komeilibacteria bacterium]|nr:isoleucine--tRNA ligase [Candidatus Komeilibacteria bacterium]